jgi:Subtilase family
MKFWKSRSFVLWCLPVVLLALVILLPTLGNTGQKGMKTPPSIGGVKPGDFIPNQIVVFAKTKDAKRDVAKLAGAVRASILHEIPRFDVYLFSFLTDDDAAMALKRINKEYFGVYMASRNWKFGIPPEPKKPTKVQGEMVLPQHVTNDPGAKASWWLEKIKEPYAGAPLAGDVNIAIIDTGVDYNHSDLSGKVVKCFDYVNWDADPMDDHGHGTHCAGIAAAKAGNGTGIHGVSPNSKIYAYKVLDSSGSGGFYQIMAAITDAADNPNVKVLSISIGGYLQPTDAAYTALRNVIKYARTTKGKVVCVAAGNEGNIYLFYYSYYGSNYVAVPAYIPECFTVGASDAVDSRAYFSNYDVSGLASGDGTVTYNFNYVDIVAPGYDILSCTIGEQYVRWNGTSMATPMVAGACARVWGKNAAFTAAQVESKLQTTGRAVGAALGWQVAQKRIDLAKALATTNTGLQGIIYDGETGFALYNVKVEAHTGSASGTLVKTVYTDKSGMFTFTGLTGGTSYYLKMIRTGYQNLTPAAVAAVASDIKDIGTPYFLVPNRTTTATDANWRIIVTWRDGQPGYNEWDWGYMGGYSSSFMPYQYYQSPGFEGNSYLKGPDGSIYYWDNMGGLGSDPYVALIHDSYFSAPIECTVIQRPKSGVYSYMVSADPDDYCWGAVKYGAGKTPIYAANPVVKIYKGNTLKQTISASAATRDGTGTMYWYVFDLNATAGTITVKNKITDTAPF